MALIDKTARAPAFAAAGMAWLICITSATGITTSGLKPGPKGAIVYDSSLDVYWLADANLAADSALRAELGVAGIDPGGAMDFAAAQNWVKALNAYNHGQGYLGHTDWQLPVTAPLDSSCSVSNAFGVGCTGSAQGNLFYVGLNLAFPSSVAPGFSDTIGPFRNLQPSLYWTSGQNSGGAETFSFATGLSGANTTKYNYFHVLPMVPHALGAPPSGPGIHPYLGGKAVYDSATGYTWAADANLALTHPFGHAGAVHIKGLPGILPLINADGAMLYGTADSGGGWIAAMNDSAYLGAKDWQLPVSPKDLDTLYRDLGLQAGDARLTTHSDVGPFRNFQPFFYWSCQRDPAGDSRSPCSSDGPAPGFQWAFNFDSGFQGTDLDNKMFYVMVYYPGKSAGLAFQNRRRGSKRTHGDLHSTGDGDRDRESVTGRRENHPIANGIYFTNPN